MYLSIKKKQINKNFNFDYMANNSILKCKMKYGKVRWVQK